MTAEDRYYVKKYLLRTDKNSLHGKYQCKCRHDWGKGMQPSVHYLHVRGDGKLEHITLCEVPWHREEIVKQYRGDTIGRSGLMTERKKNVKLWQRLKAAHAKKTNAYARKHGLSAAQAALEMEYFDMLDKELREIIRQESAPYIPASDQEE